MTPNIKVVKPPTNEPVQALIAKLNPDLKAAVESLRATLEKTGFRQEVDALKAKILKKPVRPEQQVFSFLPHQLAKTSIFFPMSDRELNEENRRITKIDHETNWGKVTIEGFKLAIYEEDIFLALLSLAKGKTQMDGGSPTFKTSMYEITNLLYGSSSYTEKTYQRIERTLEHFQLVRFALTIGEWKKSGKERLKREQTISVGNIVQSYKYFEESKALHIKFNPEFFAYFLESMLTNINFSVRRHLKKDGSKALLRFLCAHTAPGRMHISTVLNAINYNTNQPMAELRRRFKSFLIELKKEGVLGKKTQLFMDDTVCFDILPSQKSLPV